MTDDSLIQALPDLVLFVRRDGVVLQELGGRGLGLPARGQLVGQKLTEVWPENVAALLLQMTHRALRDRNSADGQFSSGGRRYEVRVTAHARERVLCVIRGVLASDAPGEREGVRGGDHGAVDRRALFAQLSQSIAVARLRERRLAVCMLHLQGARELGARTSFGRSSRVTPTAPGSADTRSSASLQSAAEPSPPSAYSLGCAATAGSETAGNAWDDEPNPRPTRPLRQLDSACAHHGGISPD